VARALSDSERNAYLTARALIARFPARALEIVTALADHNIAIENMARAEQWLQVAVVVGDMMLKREARLDEN